jgi:thiol-disulfide isomerase/thioredoxin
MFFFYYLHAHGNIVCRSIYFSKYENIVIKFGGEMKKNLIVWGIAIFLVIVAIITSTQYGKNTGMMPKESGNTDQKSSSTVEEENRKEPAGKEAAEFTLTDLNGIEVSLEDFHGKNVYLNFWATWCPPCRSEMPDLERIHQSYKDKDLVVLAVNIGEDKGTVEAYIKESNFSFRVLLDSDQRVAAEYRISSIPQSYFINREGRIAAKKIGSMSEAQMEEYIRMLE